MAHITAKASKDAGFEDEVPVNNIPECANAFIKSWQDFRPTGMASFIDDLKGLVDKQHSEVQRTFLGLSSLYVLRPEYQDSVKDNANYFDNQPGHRDKATRSLKVLVDPESYKHVYSYRPAPPQKQRQQKSIGKIDLQPLSDFFAEKDRNMLAEKAQKRCNESGIREGFDEGSFLVRSHSSQTPHTVKAVSNAGYVCDNQCLGYKSRKLCAHTIAVASQNRNLPAYFTWYKKQDKKDNLTALTTFAVNKSAGAKKPIRRCRRKSLDVIRGSQVKKTTTKTTTTKTLGDLVASNDTQSPDEASAYTAEASTNPLRTTIRKSRPPKPTVRPTTSTPFEVIELSNRIRKCAAGCQGNIRDGPDQFTQGEIDGKYCIHHKEHDFVWIESMGKFKNTFKSKHYHVYGHCIRGRNP